jgi:hypothetical protein
MRGSDRAHVEDAIRRRLGEEDATVEDRNRFRLDRPVGEAASELRSDPWRVFYRVASNEVRVLLIGKKVRESIVIDGKKYVL